MSLSMRISGVSEKGWWPPAHEAARGRLCITREIADIGDTDVVWGIGELQ